MADKTRAYLDKRISATTSMKVEVFPVNSNVRGNTTTNVSEGMNAANAAARNVPMHVVVGEFNDLQRARFFANTHAAHDCQTWLPPKVAKIHDELVESAQGLNGEVSIPDAANPEREARVLGYSGKRYYTSNLEGDRADADVKCSCGVPRVQGHPCAHNMKHALQIGHPTEKLFHFKDTTACWQEQYPQDAQWPGIDMESVRGNGHVDPLVRYPPLPAPKVGRPKGTKRERRHDEDQRASKKRKTTSTRTCGKCGVAGHTRAKCPSLAGSSSRG